MSLVKRLVFFCCIFILKFVTLQAESLYIKSFIPGQSMDNKPIICVAEDQNGLLHIGTAGGIFQFDGINYRLIALPDSLKNASVNSMLFTEKGFYIGLKEGNLLFRTNTTAFEHLLKLAAPISSLIQNQDSTIWIGSYGAGINLLSKEKQLIHFIPANYELNPYIYKLVYTNRTLWAATDAGIYGINKNANEFIIQQFTDLPDFIVTAMVADPENGLWLGFQPGEFGHFNPETTQFTHNHSTAKRIHRLAIAEDKLWMSQNNEQLISYDLTDPQIQTFTFPENILPGNIHSLIPSKNGGLWIATEKAIGWTAGQLIRFISGFNDIQAVLMDHDNTLWIASAEGLHLIEMRSNEEFHDPLKGTAFENIFITSLHQTEDQCIWIGTFDQGLLCYNPNNKVIRQFTERNGLINNNILSLESLGDTLWIASLGGVAKAILSNAQSAIKFESFDQKNEPGANYVYHLFKDSKKRIWLGTDGKGLLYYEKGRFKRAFPDTLAVNSIYSIAEANDGSIWFSASDNGLYRFYKGKLSHLTTENGLSSMTVTALKNAGNQFLIAVTAGGIDLIHSASQEVYPLSRAYGLGAYQANLNAIGQNKQGDYFIGTPHGIQILTNINQLGNRKATLFLEELQSFGESLTINPLLKLAARQNQISASYTALWYPQPELLQFEYQLQGYDQGFRLTRERQIHFNALEPGGYTLQIKLKNLPAYLGQSVIKQHIKILQPIWKRWYVWIPALLLLLISVIMIMRYRIKKIRKEQQLKRERAEFEYRNLRNQVNPHFLFNSFSTLMALIEENSSEAVEYTEQLSDYFRQILQCRDTELIRLAEELLLLENYLALQKKRYGNGLTMKIILEEKTMDTMIPPMSLQMLAENALKHNQASRSSPLQIKLSQEANDLVFCNQLQPKQNNEKSTGLGIKNIKERYLNFAGKQIRVIKNNTHFCVYLPLIPK